MRATFEEKTYENYFNNELSKRTKIYFPIGQVQEGYFGFDCSAYSTNNKLWRILGYPYISYKGCELKDIAKYMEIIIGNEIDNIPKMKANLLFQYKKPEYITVSTGKEWFAWGQPYFRYDIDIEQQELLMQIHNNFGKSILVLYAAPALHKVQDLVDAYIKSKIIDYSNFKKVNDLYGHHRNTYIQAGTYSIAFSEPEIISNFNIIENMKKMENDYDADNIQNNRDFIIDFREKLVSVINKNKNYSESFNNLNELISEIKEYELFYSLLVMKNFRDLTGTQWLIKL